MWSTKYYTTWWKLNNNVHLNAQEIIILWELNNNAHLNSQEIIISWELSTYIYKQIQYR